MIEHAEHEREAAEQTLSREQEFFAIVAIRQGAAKNAQADGWNGAKQTIDAELQR